MDFVETIYRILVPGGIWVNLGPLLYHFSDIPNEDSIEPTYEDLMIIIEAVGFEVLSSETGIRTKYAQNPQSMLKSEYESLFWICRKPVDDKRANNSSGSESESITRISSNNSNGKNVIANNSVEDKIIGQNQHDMLAGKDNFSSIE